MFFASAMLRLFLAAGVESSGDADPPPSGNDIVVTGQIEQQASAEKSGASIKDTPYSINIVDRELLDLRQPRTFVEALRTTPGISQSSPRISTQNMRSRGFSIRQAGGEFRNGLRHFENSNLSPELTNVERFELVKGPASVLYGIGGLGGALNVVTKVPDAEPRFEVEAGVGSYGFYRGAVDLNLPLGSDGVWTARLTAHRERTGSFQDFVDQDSVLISPTLAWRPDDRTSLVLDFEFLRADLSGNRTGTPADGAVILGPSGRYAKSLQVYDTQYNSIVREQIYGGYQFDHRFSDWLKLHSGLLYARSPKNDLFESNATGFVGGFTGPRRLLNRSITDFTVDWNSLAIDTNLLATFATGPIRHELLIGSDYYRSGAVNLGRTASLSPIDVFAPAYGNATAGTFTVNNRSRTRQEWYGVYLQETLIPHETLRILLSGRFTDVKTLSENRLNPALTRRAKDKPFVPRVGLVWTPAEPVSFYASYSESFLPVTGLSFSGTPFVPETGKSYEAGVKLSLLDGRASVTLAGFDMSRRNVTTTDPSNPAFNIQTGEQTSRGVEFELNGELAPGWIIASSYAHLDTEIARDNSLVVGQPLQGIPRHAANLFTTYRFKGGGLNGFGASLGVFYESRRWGQLVTPANRASTAFYLPSYTRLDAGLSYRSDRFDVTLGVNNLFDERYFSGALSRLLVYYGEGRNVTLTGRMRF